MRCPVCRAEYDLDVTCRRCKADLALPVAVERQRAAALVESARAVQRGDVTEALTHARTAHTLRAADDSLRALAAAYLLHRDFATALVCYERLTRRAESGGSP